ncbi:Piso0_003017 [Millerozyma farinosa CBS 7064]|uniref:Ribosome assembly protein 3 n=1 Tax=Pichia sorbitophila (strain ATCC MYA-4447 / BCRC 22081 / CBS 7064 / NBRC 10061 / NRRL Y-12695) TaxID=559304 RepID=G8YGY7_PICSO|nr:Piso0_003017 [Millerozyma farinosa CBS 7064]CCE80689.1 Piso0_003017 [Millerozyma farinosa CBS 7064]
MSDQQLKRGPASNKKNNRRRRKKRRTEDFSSDSDSSSDSDTYNSSNVSQNANTESSSQIKGAGNDGETNIDNIDIESDMEVPNDDNDLNETADKENNELTNDKIRALSEVKLTELSALEKSDRPNNINYEEVQSALDEGREGFQQQYLKFMASTFSGELDELRKKPDFTDKSLVTLAKCLQHGSNLFDEDTINAVSQS